MYLNETVDWKATDNYISFEDYERRKRGRLEISSQSIPFKNNLPLSLDRFIPIRGIPNPGPTADSPDAYGSHPNLY